MSDDDSPEHVVGTDLVAIYDQAVPRVYGYLLSRSGDRSTAEDLTSETFLAALRALEADRTLAVSTPWLLGIARHKMVDHWRTRERSVRRQHKLAGEHPDKDDPWDVQLDTLLVRDVLRELPPHHQAVLALRYLDGLPVREVAGHIGRSHSATEALLMRANAAFRHSYQAKEGQ